MPESDSGLGFFKDTMYMYFIWLTYKH